MRPASGASGSSFYAGMRVLPKPERAAMYAVYGFCRIVDDIADDLHGDRASRRAELDAWRADLESLYAGGEPGRAAFLAGPVRRFGLAKADFLAVLDGMQMDVDADIRAPSAALLDLYIDRVASAVGRLSVRVFGMDEAPGLKLAHHLGRALQLTNILRDFDEDAAIGRLYAPREALDRAGIAGEDPVTVVKRSQDRPGRARSAGPGPRALRRRRPGAERQASRTPARPAAHVGRLRPHPRPHRIRRLGAAPHAREGGQGGAVVVGGAAGAQVILSPSAGRT